MAKQAQARPAAAMTSARPPRPAAASVPAFGGWEVAGGGAAAAVPDYSLDFATIRVARMQRRTKAISWSSFVGNAGAVAVAVETTPGGGCAEEKRQWSSAAASDGDDDDDDRERRRLRRLRSADERLPIQPARAAPNKGRSKVKGYLFGCVSGQW